MELRELKALKRLVVIKCKFFKAFETFKHSINLIWTFCTGQRVVQITYL